MFLSVTRNTSSVAIMIAMACAPSKSRACNPFRWSIFTNRLVRVLPPGPVEMNVEVGKDSDIETEKPTWPQRTAMETNTNGDPPLSSGSDGEVKKNSRCSTSPFKAARAQINRRRRRARKMEEEKSP